MATRAWDQDINCASMAEAVAVALQTRSRSHDLLQRCTAIAGNLGFNGFSYIVVCRGNVGIELVSHCTTAGTRWVDHYANRAYHLVDPRICKTEGRSTPVAWDEVEAGEDARLHSF